MAKSFIFLRSSCEMESVPLEEKKKKEKKGDAPSFCRSLTGGAGNFSTRLKGYMGPARDPTHAQLLPRAL